MGIPTLIATNPDSTDIASISFTSGIDSTYDEYMFVMTDINPATDVAHFVCQFSTNGGSSYGMTVTTTTIYTGQYEDNSGSGGPTYQASADLAQSTSDIFISRSNGNGADESIVGILHLFTPSNTTYIKHFWSKCTAYAADNSTQTRWTTGYINSTNDVDAIIFRMSSGNLDGTIQMFGIA